MAIRNQAHPLLNRRSPQNRLQLLGNAEEIVCDRVVAKISCRNQTVAGRSYMEFTSISQNKCTDNAQHCPNAKGQVVVFRLKHGKQERKRKKKPGKSAEKNYYSFEDVFGHLWINQPYYSLC